MKEYILSSSFSISWINRVFLTLKGNDIRKKVKTVELVNKCKLKSRAATSGQCSNDLVVTVISDANDGRSAPLWRHIWWRHGLMLCCHCRGCWGHRSSRGRNTWLGHRPHVKLSHFGRYANLLSLGAHLYLLHADCREKKNCMLWGTGWCLSFNNDIKKLTCRREPKVIKKSQGFIFSTNNYPGYIKSCFFYLCFPMMFYAKGL